MTIETNPRTIWSAWQRESRNFAPGADERKAIMARALREAGASVGIIRDAVGDAFVPAGTPEPTEQQRAEARIIVAYRS